ncbi:MAG: hypothetical protein Q8Q62_14080 [Mesorhizobium sp.]|nr:hypothetical protein [Mesorhizobium sp.]
MRFLDSNHWRAITLSVAVLLLVTSLGPGVRLLMMMTLQQRRLSEAASGKVSPAVERLHTGSAKRWSKVYQALAK